MSDEKDHLKDIPQPDVPLKVALIGAGNRASRIYRPLFSSLKTWIELVAVCDPVKEHSDALAQALNVRAYTDIYDLVRDKPMEAALIVTPVPSHYSISVYLSSYGIHNLVETTWCNMIVQGKVMINTARANNAIVRVAENFFRFPIDRIVQKLRATGFIGDIHRIVSYNDHTGYHNNSRWIAFAGAHPTWVQSIEHTMPTAEFYFTPERFHKAETYRARFFTFPHGLLVMDHASNLKGLLGRHSRPGYTEWQGTRGTIVYAPSKPWEGTSEVRYCSTAQGRGIHDQTFPIIDEYENGVWTSSYVDLPIGRIEHTNPFRPSELPPHINNWYGSPIMDHIVDFALSVRGLRNSEFDEQDALMSLMMETGAKESALNEGKRTKLPLKGESEVDMMTREALTKQFKVDPFDVEGMLAISYPKP